MLDIGAQRMRLEVMSESDEIEGPVGRGQLQVKRDQPEQDQQSPHAEVEGNLEGCEVFIFAPAPDANHDEGRHEGEFVEKVKEKEIERSKRAEYAAAHDQQ